MRLPTPFIPCDSWSCTLAHLFELPSSSFDPSYNVALMHSTSVSKTIHTTITSTHKKADRIKWYSQSCNGQSPWQLINISSTHNFCSWTIQIKLHYRPRLLLLDIFLCAASVYIFLFHILFLPLPFLFFDCQSSICRKKIRIELFAIGTMARKREREREEDKAIWGRENCRIWFFLSIFLSPHHDFVGTKNFVCESWWKTNTRQKVHVKKTTSLQRTNEQNHCSEKNESPATEREGQRVREREKRRIKRWTEFNIFAYEIRSLTAFLATLPIRVRSFFPLSLSLHFFPFVSIIFMRFLRGSAVSWLYWCAPQFIHFLLFCRSYSR